MLIGIKGLTGHGKTLFMTMLAISVRQIWRSCRVYANYDLRLPQVERINTLEQLSETMDGVVCIDEGGVIFDSRGFQRWENNAATQWLVQTRHAGLIVITTCQILSQLDKRFRECMDYLIDCRKRNNVFTASVVDMSCYRILCHWTIPNPSAIYPFYDTRSSRVEALQSEKPPDGRRKPWKPYR